MKIDEAFWEGLGSEEKDVWLQAAIVFPPISVDILFHTLPFPPTSVLKAIERLDQLAIMKPSASNGTGFYDIRDKRCIQAVLERASRQRINDAARALLAYFEANREEGPDKWRQMAHIYHVSQLPVRHAPAVIKAAEYDMKTNRLKSAFTYYHLIVKQFSGPLEKDADQTLYVKAAVGLCANSEDLLPLSIQERIVTRALDYVEYGNDPSLHVKTLIFKARCMMRQGDFKGADGFYSQALDITRRAEDPRLTKWISAYKSDIEIWRGHIQSAVHQYEKLVGKLEEFPSNAMFLKAYSRLGWSYGICGDLYRGLGIVNVVQKKAAELNIRYIEIYAELMKLMILADSRRIKEARESLETILKHPESELDHYVLWAAYGKKAYFDYLEGDLPGAYAAYKTSVAHAEKLECAQYHGSDNLEYLYAFEKEGLEENIYRNEISRVLSFPDIYTRGAALRFRAMSAMTENRSAPGIEKDLEQSLKLLEDAGAKVELAQTQVTLAKFLLSNRKSRTRARKLIKAAWETFSNVNADLFPDVLKPYVDEDDKEALIVDTIVEAGNTLSRTRDRYQLLSDVIRIIMRLVVAERGGIFLLTPDGDIRLESSRNLEPGTVGKDNFKFSLDLIRRVARTGEKSISFGKFASLMITGRINEIGWVICYPIVLRDKILGVLYADNSFSGVRPSKHRLALLKAIGNQIAVALDNVDAYEKISQLRYRLEAETRFYRKESHKPAWARHIVGESRGIRNVLDTIKEVAPSDATVLITGETGVGKELAARAIHDISKRADGPFIPINIAAISPELVYSELFGHVKGAFTGALSDHVGRFELANGGSFFLDDVDGLSLDTQVKLLRVLESREFQRVGDNRHIQSDFRLIAATNQNLELLVGKGKFRSDFYYRLNVVPITIPPLRRRKEDIPLLTRHFIALFCRKLGKPLLSISGKNIDRLTDYAWPGNVRELSHYIERAVILTRGSRLRLPRQNHAPVSGPGDPDKFPGLEEMIRTHIQEALNRCNGKVGGKNGAAALLKMNPQTLYSRINRLGLKK